jgi:hypothetical protein
MARDVLRASHKRVRRSRRPASSGTLSAPPSSGAVPVADLALGFRRLAAECARTALGLDACVKHARQRTNAERAAAAAAEIRTITEELAALAVGFGVELRVAEPTCERLRWEWLASTAGLLDGAPDERLFAECARAHRGACEAAEVLARRMRPEAAATIRPLADRLGRALIVATPRPSLASTAWPAPAVRPALAVT